MSGAPPEFAPIQPGTVSVVVTVLKDPRVARTLESLLAQSRLPDEVLVDDGGITDQVLRITESFRSRDPRVRHLDAPGNIPESRNTALLAARGEFVAFLDADEIAPPGWLAALLAPFDDPTVGFTGGPTPALQGTTHSVGARYYDGYLRRFYEVEARHHPHALPMGNSAWRASVFRQVGLLDTTLYRRAASEDQEVADRVLKAGFRGVYVPEAWVDHDFSDISTLGLLRKQRVYAEGGFVVWRRRGTTYEASGARVLPYVLLPLLAVAGAVLLLLPSTRLWGELLVLAGLGGLAALAAVLTLQGRALDHRFPGLRYRALEIPRRWATLYGAFRGLLDYGWSGTGRSPKRAASGEGAAKP
ncbi:MAG: glycosyltransferase [Thermoplasmata archaeon]|nr:glycosyltransferase [Thermoplasmata archaeon]